MFKILYLSEHTSYKRYEDWWWSTYQNKILWSKI